MCMLHTQTHKYLLVLFFWPIEHSTRLLTNSRGFTSLLDGCPVCVCVYIHVCERQKRGVSQNNVRVEKGG